MLAEATADLPPVNLNQVLDPRTPLDLRMKLAGEAVLARGGPMDLPTHKALSDLQAQGVSLDSL